MPSVTKPAPIIYTYTGTNAQGKSVNGEIEGDNINLAKANLRKQGITPIKVQKQSKPFFSFSPAKKIKPADISHFTRQLATMVAAGVPLVQSFDIVAKGTDSPAFKTLILDIKTEIEAGRSFSEALKKFPLYFDDLFCNLIHAGETSGSLDQMLDRIATYKEKSEALKAKLKKAILYPTAVLIIAMGVSIILLIFVVPQFEQLFKSFGAQLPAFTLMIIQLSNFLQEKWPFLLAGAIGIGFLFKHFKKTSKSFREFLDRLVLKIPVVGNIIHKAAIARYARTLSTTFAAGVPLTEALDAVAGAAGNVVYSNAILNIRSEVTTGSQIQAAMRNTQVFPNMVVQMVAIGEESGSLDAMLTKVANIYEAEVDVAVDGLSSLLEPVIMVILGVIVGSLVIAMYLPIFKMGSIV